MSATDHVFGGIHCRLDLAERTGTGTSKTGGQPPFLRDSRAPNLGIIGARAKDWPAPGSRASRRFIGALTARWPESPSPRTSNCPRHGGDDHRRRLRALESFDDPARETIRGSLSETFGASQTCSFEMSASDLLAFAESWAGQAKLARTLRIIINRDSQPHFPSSLTKSEMAIGPQIDQLLLGDPEWLYPRSARALDLVFL